MFSYLFVHANAHIRRRSIAMPPLSCKRLSYVVIMSRKQPKGLETEGKALLRRVDSISKVINKAPSCPT